jgi:hypothetical protein
VRAASAGSVPSKRAISPAETLSSANARRIFIATSGSDGNSSEPPDSEPSSRSTSAAVAARVSL